MTELAFVMGAARSGSTLLTMLLGSQPMATTIGETVATSSREDPDYLCSCGHKARECPFWLRVISEMRSRGVDLNLADFGTAFEYPKSRFINRILRAEYRGPIFEAVRDAVLCLHSDWRRQSRAIAERNLALFETLTSVTNSQVLIDSSKQPHRLKFLLRLPGLKVKVIHLVRDGHGVVRSYMKTYGWSVEKSAMEWRRSVLAAEKLLARLKPDMWIQIRYEDLCSHPQAELQKLCAFLDLDTSRVNMNFRSAGLHVFGNRMRLSSDQTVCLDEKWRAELTSCQMSTIEHIVGKQLAKYGYNVNGF